MKIIFNYVLINLLVMKQNCIIYVKKFVFIISNF